MSAETTRREREIQELSAEVDRRQRIRDEIGKSELNAMERNLRELNAEQHMARALAKRHADIAAKDFDAAVTGQLEAMEAYVNACERVNNARETYRAARREAMALDVPTPIVQTAASRHAASTTEGWKLRTLFARFQTEARGLI